MFVSSLNIAVFALLRTRRHVRTNKRNEMCLARLAGVVQLHDKVQKFPTSNASSLQGYLLLFTPAMAELRQVCYITYIHTYHMDIHTCGYTRNIV